MDGSSNAVHSQSNAPSSRNNQPNDEALARTAYEEDPQWFPNMKKDFHLQRQRAVHHKRVQRIFNRNLLPVISPDTMTLCVLCGEDVKGVRRMHRGYYCPDDKDSGVHGGCAECMATLFLTTKMYDARCPFCRRYLLKAKPSQRTKIFSPPADLANEERPNNNVSTESPATVAENDGGNATNAEGAPTRKAGVESSQISEGPLAVQDSGENSCNQGSNTCSSSKAEGSLGASKTSPDDSIGSALPINLVFPDRKENNDVDYNDLTTAELEMLRRLSSLTTSTHDGTRR